MSEEKRNRILAAVTVNVILLIAILASVCIYQLVVMVNLNKMKNDLEDSILYYETMTDKNNATLDYYKTEEGLLDKAYEYGFVMGK